MDTLQGCAPLIVNFTDASKDGIVVRRDWNLGNGTTIPNGASTVGGNYLNPGTYTITLTATFDNGIIRQVSKNLIVHPKPIADFSASETAGCRPFATNFQDLSSTPTGTIAKWQWDFGAGGSTLQNPGFTFNNPGNYQVKLVVTNNWGCISDAESKPNYIQVYQPPVAGFTTDKNSSCELPFTVQFTNTTSGNGPLTYEWDFGDGSPVSTDTNPSHTYTTAGVHRVRLTVRLGNQCINTFTTNINSDIYAGRPVAAINAPDAVCAGNSVFFSGTTTPVGLASQYRWVFSDNGSVRTGANVNYTFSSPGTYEVMLIASTRFGCADTVRKTIEVKPGPVVDFTGDKFISSCVPFEVNFTNTLGALPGYSFLWNFGDGNTSTQPNPTHVFTSQGNRTITLTVTDTSIADGCAMTISKNSFIRIRIPSLDFFTVPPEGCRPLPVTATARISGLIESIDRLIWNWGDGITDTITNGNLSAFHVYPNPGLFNIGVGMVTESGCLITAPLHAVSVANICDDDGSGGGGSGSGGGGGFEIGKNCDNKYEVNFTDTVSNSIVLEWDFGDGTIVNSGTLNPITHTYSPPQKVYHVKVTRRDILTGDISVGEKNIIIIDEKADFKPDITDICANKTVNFTPSGIDSSKIKRYIWDFGDGSPRQIIQNQNYSNSYGIWLTGKTSYTYTTNGTYYAKLIIEDKLGCLDSLEYPVPIEVAGPVPGLKALNITSCDATQLVQFTDSSTQNGLTPIVQWQWNFGDGTPVYTTSSDTSIHHTYNNTYYYNFRTVTLNILDAAGCEASVTKSSYIRGYRPRADFYSLDTLQCDRFTVRLYNQSQAYNATYLWQFGDGATSTSSSAIHTYPANGSYDIRLTVTDENGCMDSATKTGYIRLIEPVADFEIGDTSQCAPAAILFTDKSLYATAWEWDFGDGGNGSMERNPSAHIYANPGFYNVRLIVTGPNGCRDTVVKQIRIRGPIATWDAVGGISCKPFVFNARVTGSFIQSYAWDFGDGTPVYASTKDSVISHTYSNAGKYLPNLILRSPEGCPFTLKLQDTIYVDSLKTDFTVDNDLFCGVGTITFENLSEVPGFSSITSYQWNFGDGTPNSDLIVPPAHTFEPGNYTVSLTATSQYGCTKSASKNIHVYSNPVITLTGPAEGCLHDSLYFKASVISPDEIINRTWTLGGRPSGTNEAIRFGFQTEGLFSVGYEIKTKNGCSASASMPVTIRPLPVPNASPVDATICIGNSISLSATDGAQYQWYPADGLRNANSATPVATPLSNTKYFVKVTNRFGCVQYDSVMIRVDERVDLKHTPNMTMCEGSSVQLSASGNTDQIMWSPMDGLNAGAGMQIVASPQTTTTYTVTGVSKNVCPDESSRITVTVVDNPVIDLGPDIKVPAGTHVTIPTTASVNVIKYTWTPSSGLNCITCAQPTFIADKDVTYRLTVQTIHGCEAADEINIQVLCNGESVFIPNAFTPNNDGLNDVFYVSGYGISKVTRLTIFDRWGKVVFENKDFTPGDPRQGWNGRIRNTEITSTTVFAYVIELECVTGDHFVRKGTVTLVR